MPFEIRFRGLLNFCPGGFIVVMTCHTLRMNCVLDESRYTNRYSYTADRLCTIRTWQMWHRWLRNVRFSTFASTCAMI